MTENKTKNKPAVEVEKSQLDQDRELALANLALMQKQRAEAPEGVSVENKIESERKNLINRYIKNPEHEAGFNHNTPARHRRMVSQGWIPVLEILGGKSVHVTSGDDLMYERPKVFTHEKLVHAANVSNSLMKKHHKGFEKNAPGGTVLQNETTITKDKIEQ